MHLLNSSELVTVYMNKAQQRIPRVHISHLDLLPRVGKVSDTLTVNVQRFIFGKSCCNRTKENYSAQKMEQCLVGFAARGVFLACYSTHILENEETLDDYALVRK